MKSCDWCGLELDEGYEVQNDVVCRGCYLEGFVRDQV